MKLIALGYLVIISKGWAHVLVSYVDSRRVVFISSACWLHDY